MPITVNSEEIQNLISHVHGVGKPAPYLSPVARCVLQRNWTRVNPSV